MRTTEQLVTSEIFNSALQAVDPRQSVLKFIPQIEAVYKNGKFKKLFVIAFGKAACAMAFAVEETMGGLIDSGVVITKYGHCNGQISKIDVYEAGHPLPDENGLHATEKVINLLKDADDKDLVVCLISGGGSALLATPLSGITLPEKQAATNLLLKAGADINELNTVRKHISSVKGGRLAEIAYPAKVVSLILSDVIGDRLDIIASGPTAPDSSTFSDALSVLDKYGIRDSIAESIKSALTKGAEGLIAETPKDPVIFSGVENIIIGSLNIAIDAACKKAKELGFKTEIISRSLSGEAKDTAVRLASKARNALAVMRNESFCLISGGETTVTVKGTGKGGRNMELALAFALQIDGTDGITLLSAGTDGTDGPTDAAGAVVDANTIKRAKAMGLKPQKYLDNNDSYTFFKKTGGLFMTGPTGTNVMDLQIILING